MRVRTAIDLGLLIRERRRAIGLDQRVLAELVGVSRQWVVEAERGKPRAPVELLLRTLDALGLVVQVESEQEHASRPSKPKAARRVVPRIDLDAVIDRARGRKP